MNRDLPPFVSAYRDRHGKLRHRFRRTGRPTLHFAGVIGSDEFWRAYLAWRDDTDMPRIMRAAPGTFNDLIAQFYASKQWRNIPKEATRRVYRGELERFREKYGERPAATMTARNVEKLLEKMGDTPSAANNLLKRLRSLFDYAILLGMRADNPAKAVKGFRIKSEGFHTWTEAEIELFEARHATGTKARLALALLLYTGQRRSDIVTMGRQADGKVRVRQLKTGKLMALPMHAKLREAIAAMPVIGSETYLVTSFGKPFTAAGFGNKFREWCNEAGLLHCSAHGLRKACARRMAEQGLSNQLIKSITGHSGDSEVALYTRAADQERMAVLAMEHMEAADLANMRNRLAKQGAQDAD